MNRIIPAGRRSGTIKAKASKSVAHRMLIAAALSEEDSCIKLNGLSEDIAATVDCLNAIGADIRIKEDRIDIKPIKHVVSDETELHCKESGSTLRFLLPLCGALGVKGSFCMEGRLSERPNDVFAEILEAKGMTIKKEGNVLSVSGRLQAGRYEVPGDISSQYITGLLFALPLLEEESIIEIKGKLQSKDYISLTEKALEDAGVGFEKKDNTYLVSGKQRYSLPKETEVEGDWSNAAPFLCMGALSEKGVLVEGLNTNSAQGDRRILEILKDFGADVIIEGDRVEVRKDKLKGMEIDSSDIPDIIPAICVVASSAEGKTVIRNAGRLRLKESDRLVGSVETLKTLGGIIGVSGDEIHIEGNGGLEGGKVSSYGDHRMAMMAAVAACICSDDVEIDETECVKKSYPDFWDDLDGLIVCR